MTLPLIRRWTRHGPKLGRHSGECWCLWPISIPTTDDHGVHEDFRRRFPDDDCHFPERRASVALQEKQHRLTGSLTAGDKGYNFRCNISRGEWEFDTSSFNSIVSEVCLYQCLTERSSV